MCAKQKRAHLVIRIHIYAKSLADFVLISEGSRRIGIPHHCPEGAKKNSETHHYVKELRSGRKDTLRNILLEYD